MDVYSWTSKNCGKSCLFPIIAVGHALVILIGLSVDLVQGVVENRPGAGIESGLINGCTTLCK